MDLLWPGFLALLGLIPLLLIAYIVMLRRRRRYAVRYSSLSLVREALAGQSRWRRHLPFALFLLGLTSLIIALVRPVAIVSVPTSQTAIVLTMDVSRSMRAIDIQPSRIEAAKAAALSFIQGQKASTQIGLVAFAGFAEMVHPPTRDQEALETAIESLTLGRGTAVGAGILSAIDVIAEIDPYVARSVRDESQGIAPTPVPQGAYAPDTIVVLTDGVSTTGPPPLEAAQQAVDRGVRIYTIGFGTANGSFGGGPQPDSQFGGGFRRGIDEETLKKIAEMTGGEYYSAESAGELTSVFENLPTYLITRHEIMELSVAFTALGALLAALAIGLSLRWHPLP
jgi:Ca-activated chloride channel family protein